MCDRHLFFNGIDAETGDYLLPGMSSAQFAAFARRSPVEKAEGRGVKAGVIPESIEDAGWGVVFPYGVDPEVRRALAPLLEHRRRQATSLRPKLFKELPYRPGANKRQFLTSFGALPAGPVDPEVVPYYLLLVGDPRQIPYSFQYDLAVQYAVGRLAFDTPEEYARYAESVVESETRAARRRRRALLFATRHPGDPATDDTTEKLVRPLAEALASVETVLDGEATKAALGRVLGGDRTPALLFTVSHGLGFNRVDHPLKKSHHGALVLSDWPGPSSGKGPLSEDYCFTAADLGDDADVSDMITFHLGCWTAGTPEHDYFIPGKRIAEHDFIARLPQRLLTHPRGSALAVVGHVDRAWLHIFLWKGVSRATLFEAVLTELLASVPVGRAMRYFGETAADLANDVLSGRNGDSGAGDEEYSETWVSYRDARSYLILGDPAVRLRFAEEEA